MQKARKNPNKTPYSKLSRYLHAIMMCLCLCASIALFRVDSIRYKIMLSIMLLAYAAFMLTNSNAQELIFRIYKKDDQKNYLKVHQWNEGDSTPTKNKINPKYQIKQKFYKKINNQKNQTKQQIDQDSLSKSMSINKTISKSHLNESHLSNSKMSSSRLQSRGQDLLNLSYFNQSQSRMGRSTISNSDKNIQILDRKLIARINQPQSQSENTFEKQLKQINKTSKYIHNKYKTILSYINRIVYPVLNEHRSNTVKIKELSIEYFQIVIDEQVKQPDQYVHQYELKPLIPLKISVKKIIQKIMHAYFKSQSYQTSKLPIKKDKKWNDFQKKIILLLAQRLIIATKLGVNNASLSSKEKDSSSFVKQYNSYISMIQTFISADLQNKKNLQAALQDKSEQNLSKQFKSRIYILFLFVKSVNDYLNGVVKINLKDYLGFMQLVKGDSHFQISPKHSYDAYIPYFNLSALQKGIKIKQYTCEYGSTNYLSIIYLLMHQLSKKPETIKNKPQIIKMINEIL